MAGGETGGKGAEIGQTLQPMCLEVKAKLLATMEYN